jgi:small multidrug resistance pump
MPYLILLSAIAIEVVASLALKASGGFVRLGYSAVALVGFGLSLWLLARVSAILPISVTYPTWAGLGIVGATFGGALLFAERITGQHLTALALIVLGVALMHAPLPAWAGGAR